MSVETFVKSDVRRELEWAERKLSFRLELKVDGVPIVAARLDDLALSCIARGGVLELLGPDQLYQARERAEFVELSLVAEPEL